MQTETKESIKVSPAMIKAGLNAWWNESGFHGPPDVDGAEIVTVIFRAMILLCDTKSESIHEL